MRHRVKVEAQLAAGPVSTEAVAKVDVLRDRVLSLGWSEAALYQDRGRYRFPVGGDYGRMCFLRGQHQVGKAVREHIEIVCPNGSTLRFHNRELQSRGRRGLSRGPIGPEN